MPRSAIKPHTAITLIVITCFAYGLSIGMNFVTIPLLFKNHGASKSLIGLLMGMEIAAAFCMAPLLPFLIRKYGMGKILLAAGIIRNSILLFLPVAHAPLSWFPLMFLVGGGGFTLYITVQMWINTLATDKRRATALSALTAFISLGIALGPIILTLTGRGGFPPFLVSSLFCSLILLPFFAIRHMLPRHTQMEKSNAHIFSILRKSPLPLLGGTVSDFIFFSMSSFLVIYGLMHGLTEVNASFLITAMMTGSILVQIPAGWLSDRVNRPLMVVICTAIILICSQMLAYAIQSTYGTWLIFTVCSGAISGVYTSSLALLAEKFRGKDLIAANSAFALMNSIGGISGVVLSGFAMDVFGAEGLTYSIASICSFYLIINAIRYQRKTI